MRGDECVKVAITEPMINGRHTLWAALSSEYLPPYVTSPQVGEARHSLALD